MDKYHIITGVVVDRVEVDPTCHRCNYKSSYVIEILPSREWVCTSCLTDKEIDLIKLELK